MARFIGAPARPHEIVFTKNVTEAINLVATVLGRDQPARRRRRRADRDRAPRQHRAVAHARRGARHRAPLRARSTDDYRLDLDDLDGCSTGRSCSPSRPCRTCSAPSTPSADLADAAHRARRLVAGRRRPVRRRTARRRRRARRRLRRLHGPQDARPDRDRRAVGPRGAARGDAAVPRRRRDDPRRRLDGFTPARRPGKFEAGTPPIAEAVGLAAADRLPRRARAWTRSRAHEVALTAYALAALEERSGTTCGSSGRPTVDRPGRRHLVRLQRRPPPRHRPGRSTSTGVCVRPGHHCAKPLMRRSASARPRGRPSTLSTTRTTSTCWSRRLAAAVQLLRLSTERCADARPRRPLPRDHPRPLPLAAEPRRAGLARRPHRVEGFNPLCGDEVVVYLDVEDGVLSDVRIAGRAARSASRRPR